MTFIPWQATVQDDGGNAVPSPVVTVRNAADDTLATIYDMTGVATSNPITGGADGFVQFQVLRGRYKIEGAKDGSIASTWQWEAQAADNWNRSFASRSDVVSELSSLSTAEKSAIPDGAIWSWPDASVIKSTGATAIADMQDFVPFGDVCHPDHFAENTIPGTTDMGAAMIAARDYGPTKLKPTIYGTSVEVALTDGHHFVGSGAFWKRRTGYSYTGTEGTNSSVIKFIGTPGANTVAVRISEKAVGVVGTDFTTPGTDDVVNVVARDFHVDANGADYGVYVYRAGNQSTIGNITAEGAARANHVHLGCYAAFFGTFGAYESVDVGAIIGYDEFGWGSVESTNFAYKAEWIIANNGTGGTFIEGTATDLDGAGALIVVGRGSRIRITSESNDGRAFFAEPWSVGGGVGATTIIEAAYIEGNGTGAKLVQPSDDGGMIIQDGFIHPGNGGSLAAQDFDIEAQNSIGVATDDEGPDNPEQWILLKNLHGGFDVNSNTDRYRMEECGIDTTFTDRRPTNPFKVAVTEAINGDFSVWQQGAGAFSANGYTADQWYLDLSGATGSVSQQSLTPGALPGFGAPSPEYFLELAVTVGNADAGMQLHLADVRRYSNRRLIIPFWAKSDTVKTYRVDVTQNFGSGGSASVATIADNISIGTGWRRYAVACDVPSISGKTIGADNYISIRIRQTAAVTFTLGLAAFAIEGGQWGPSIFRQRPRGEEEELCGAFFRRLVSGTDIRMGAAGQAIGTTASIYGIQYDKPMYKTPTLAISAASDFATTGASGADQALTALTLSQANEHSCRLVGTVASGLTAGNATLLKSTSANATLDLDARLV